MVEPIGLGFEWDLTKELENIRKHGLTFGEAVETFSDPDGIAQSDITHSDEEPRFFWIGKSRSGRVLTTRYTHRESVKRIIGSAEWRKFRKLYETTKAKRPGTQSRRNRSYPQSGQTGRQCENHDQYRFG